MDDSTKQHDSKDLLQAQSPYMQALSYSVRKPSAAAAKRLAARRMSTTQVYPEGDHQQPAANQRELDVGPAKTLIQAAELGNVEAYRKLKEDGRQDIMQRDIPYLYSSLLYACYGDQYKVLQLIECEYAKSAEQLTTWHTTRCWFGKNSAMVAAYQGHISTVLYLVDLDLRSGFTPGVDIFEQRDLMGKTAMDWAAGQGHSDTLEVLLIRCMYKLLPAACTNPVVRRTRWRLVRQLYELAMDLKDYRPSHEHRRMFEEVLTNIGYAGDAGDDDWDEEPPTPMFDAEGDAVEYGNGASLVEAHTLKRQRTPAKNMKDVHLSVLMLQDVITAAHVASCEVGGISAMGTIMYLQEVLREAKYFDNLTQQCTTWMVSLLDACRNKMEVQAILTPTDRAVGDHKPCDSEPVGFSLDVSDKIFLSHKFVQQLFTEKWDTMGVSDYMRSVMAVLWCICLLVPAFMGYCVACPFVLLLRSFFTPVELFLQRGKVIVDSRFPWHVPLFRWMLAQCCLMTLVGLLTYTVFQESETQGFTPIGTLLAVWCVATLVDEVQEFIEEGKATYMQSGWNFLDIFMSLFYLAHFVLRVSEYYIKPSNDEWLDALLVANDLLAGAALLAWIRVVSVLELSESIGPLIQMMKQMLLIDASRFLLLVVIMLMGFTVGMQALFQSVCVRRDTATQECVEYTEWSYHWQADKVIGGMTMLQYLVMGQADATEFEQKRVTGLIFYIVFAIVTSILLLNLFIAMLADTYTRVSTQAAIEFRYRKARIMASFGNRDPFFPPFNLLLLLFAIIGNTVRRLLFKPGSFVPVSLHKSDPTLYLFKWYFPQNDDDILVVDITQKRVVGTFIDNMHLELIKTKLQCVIRYFVNQEYDKKLNQETLKAEVCQVPKPCPGNQRKPGNLSGKDQLLLQLASEKQKKKQEQAMHSSAHGAGGAANGRGTGGAAGGEACMPPKARVSLNYSGVPVAAASRAPGAEAGGSGTGVLQSSSAFASMSAGELVDADNAWPGGSTQAHSQGLLAARQAAMLD